VICCWMIVLLTQSRIIPDTSVQGLLHKRGVESSGAALKNIKEQSILSCSKTNVRQE
jgi:hypothetical protein